MGLLDKALSKKKHLTVSEKPKVEAVKNKEFQTEEDRSGYQTVLDRIYYLVQKSGSISLKEVSDIINIPTDDVENYAKILSKDNLIIMSYPTTGSPKLIRKEGFKKEKKNVGILKNKKVISFFVLSTVVVFGVIAFTSIFKNKTMIVSQETKEMTKEETKEVVTLGTAFSGEGAYKCEFEKEDIGATYYIKDEIMRVETMIHGKNNIVIVKEGYTYTYLDTKDSWTKVKTSEDTVIPGSGKVPTGEGIIIDCFESAISEDQFDIDEEKII